LNLLIKFGNLHTLDISNNNLGDSGVKLLSRGLYGKISLEKLTMVDCKFTMLGGEDLFMNMGSNASLKEINISSNKIGQYKEANLVNRKTKATCI